MQKFINEGQTKEDTDWDYVRSPQGIGLILLAGASAGLGGGCWTMSFSYTSVAQSYLFNSLHPQLILLARITQLLPVFWEVCASA